MTRGGRLLALVAMTLVGCTVPTIENDVRGGGGNKTTSGGGGGSGDGSGGATDPGGDTGAGTGSGDPSETPAGADPAKPPATAPDGDNDGVPDATDCDPANANVVGTKLFDDALSSDAASFAPSLGFAAASWAYDTGAYRQLRLADAVDASFFTKDVAVEELDMQVAAASTEISTTITPRLRQLMILFGARSDGATFSAYGCGAEVVGGLAVEQRTSLVKLSGSAGALATTPLVRTERTAVQANETFTIKLVVKGGKATCTLAQGATGSVVTTAEAPVTDTKGAVGFLTRQTKAAFKTAKACKTK